MGRSLSLALDERCCCSYWDQLLSGHLVCVLCSGWGCQASVEQLHVLKLSLLRDPFSLYLEVEFQVLARAFLGSSGHHGGHCVAQIHVESLGYGATQVIHLTICTHVLWFPNQEYHTLACLLGIRLLSVKSQSWCSRSYLVLR